MTERPSVVQLRYSVSIRAPRETVWDRMIDDEGYRFWTSAFTAGSHFKGSWEAGAKIRFLDPNGGGMTAVIAESRKPEFISIKHLGYVKDGVDDTESEEVRSWAPAFENYSFRSTAEGTEVSVVMDCTKDFVEFMEKTWPKALEKLKALCEGQA